MADQISTVRIKVNGKSVAWPDAATVARLETLTRTKMSGAVNDKYDITVNITATKKNPPVIFRVGDVYQYAYNSYGDYYTFVRGNGGWSGNGDMTDDVMRAGLVDRRARKCKVVPE